MTPRLEMGGDFSGEVATFYASYRRGYPPAFIDVPGPRFTEPVRVVALIGHTPS